MAENTFLVSVANAIIRYPDTKQLIALGKANITSAFNLTMASQDVRGGINAPLLFKYMHSRNVEINIEQATFEKSFLALQLGKNVVNGSYTVVKEECITLVSNIGVCSETPIGNISVKKIDGTIITVTPTGKNFTVPSGGNTSVDIVYNYTDTVDRLVISSTTPPSIVELTLTAEVRNTANQVAELFQITIDRFQIDGNYNLSLSSTGVSQEGLKGMALVSLASGCNSESYGSISWIPQAITDIPVAVLATIPNEFVVSVAGGLPKTQQLTVYGIRGGAYTDAILSTGLTFTKRTGGGANISVSGTGLVTVASGATAGQTAIIDISYTNNGNTLTDTMNVTVVA